MKKPIGLQEMRNEQAKGDSSKLSLGIMSALTGALVGLLASFASEMLKGHFGQELERSKLEYSLVQSALSAGDRKAATEELDFYVRLGFLRDESGRIRSVIRDPTLIPDELLERSLKQSEGDSFILGCSSQGGQFKLATFTCILPNGETLRFMEDKKR